MANNVLEEQYRTDLERIKQLNKVFGTVSIGLIRKKEKKGKNESGINKNQNNR
jgi:hypothetical protein